MENITVRKASINDIGTLLGFEQGVIKAERPFDSTLKEGHIHYYDIRHMIESSHIEIAVAESENEIIACGYARIESPKKPYLKHALHAYLGFMYTDPAHRGKAANKKIIDALRQWCIAQNITELRLDVYYNNQAAINAYEKAGFSKHMIEMRMGLDNA